MTDPKLRLRRARTAAVGAALAVVPLAAACQVETTVAYSCSLIGTLETTFNSDASPDSVSPGGTITHALDVTLPAISVDVPVNRVTVNYPLPDQIARIDSLGFESGNLDGSWEVKGRNLVLAFTGDGVSSTALELPDITLNAVVDAGAPGGTVVWPAPDQIAIDVDFAGSPLTESCTRPDGTPEINNTNLEGSAEPGWTPTPTVGSPATATTKPVGGATTTTTLPTTTTTGATTSTTGGTTTTTTTAPPTLTPVLDSRIELACAIAGPLSVQTGAVHAPEPVAPGGAVKLAALLDPDDIAENFNLPLTGGTIRVPLPAGITVTEAKVSGGNLTGTATVQGSELVIALTAPAGTTINSAVWPRLDVTATVAANASGTITVAAPTSFVISVDFLGTPLDETCTTAAGAPALEVITVG